MKRPVLLVLLVLTLTAWNPAALDPVLNVRLLFQSLLVMYGGWVCYIEMKKQQWFISKANALFFVCLSLYVCYTFSGVFRGSIFWTEALFEWMKILNYLLLSLIFFITFQNDKNAWLRLAKAVVAVSLIAEAVALGQYVEAVTENGFQLENADAVKSIFANKNIFAEMLPAFACTQLLVLFFEKKKMWRVLAAVGLFIGFFFLIVTISRNVWLAVGLMMLYWGISLVLFAELRSVFLSKKMWMPMAIAVVLALFFAVGERKELQDFFNYRNTGHERELIWKGTLQMFREHPVCGVGTGSWKIEIMRLHSLGIRGFATFFQQPHNDYLWVLSEQGVLGVLLGVLAVTVLSFQLFANYFNSKEKRLPLLLTAYFLSYAVISIFAFPRERIEHNTLLSLFTGMLLWQSNQGKLISSKKMRGLLVSCFVVAGSAGVVIAVLRLHAESNLVQVQQAKSEKNWGDMFAKSEAAENVCYHYDGVATPVCWYAGLALFNSNNMVMAEQQFRRALRFNPYHPFTLSNLGACAEMQGRRKDALTYFNEALHYAPGFPDAVLNRAAIEYQSGHPLEAAETFATISDTTSTPRFETFRATLMGAMVDSVQQSTTDSLQQVVLESVKTDRAWQLQMILKAQQYQRTLMQQLLLDVNYCTRQLRSNIN